MNETLLHCLMTFGISMVPVVELRGAIPYGLAFDLPLPLVLAVSVLGNMVPVPFIALFIRKIFAYAIHYRAYAHRVWGCFYLGGKPKQEP